MKTNRYFLPAALALGALLLCGMAATAQAGDVDVRLSSREAYVGMPLTLQISISNASDYEHPSLPNIDGCDVRSAGAPSQSSQVTIINGRRTENRSVTLQYSVTPRREGTFEVPPLTVEVDGRIVTTPPLRFVAIKSVTGDLLFVEITGGKDKVFVGEPLDLSLKIWLKPFRDAERNMTLSEADMWSMISEQTSWGGFGDRVQELASNNQRPGGKEVLRDDGQGNQRSYYLYVIDATVYPKRAGKIDARDVQIVVNYPTALGTSRSPFGSFFQDSPFGGNSPFSRMMDDDLFASPFGDRLAVTAARPIVGDVSVDATEVTPVPQAGRPADYRGAVGRYQIVTQASPTEVDAGDPITLNIGIAGNGPMELVQAPPLSELPTLTKQFHVADQSLAGFVQDETKVFSTTIRPRQAGITEIPAIPFSFFDPETESFQTVMSEPIAITVHESETLALDAIVGSSREQRHGQTTDLPQSTTGLPDFTNNSSPNILASQSPPASVAWWWALVVLPPSVWLGILLFRNRRRVVDRLLSFQSARKRCLSAIDRAATRDEITAALTQYVARTTRTPCQTMDAALGQLRVRGLYEMANEIDAYVQDLQRSPISQSNTQSLESHRRQAQDLVGRMAESFKTEASTQIRRSPVQATPSAVRALKRSLLLIVAVLLSVASATGVSAAEAPATSELAVADVALTLPQQQTILAEASADYSQASDLATTDSAAAKQLFESAAARYQLLVDAKVHNSQLYLNLGNAYLQSGELGRAIASYERGRQLDPTNRQLFANLPFAESKVKNSTPKANANDASGTLGWLTRHLRSANDVIVQTIGLSAVISLLVVTSLIFWGLWIVRAMGIRCRVWRFAAAPLFLLLVSLGSYCLASTGQNAEGDAVIVADHVELYAGDGSQFDKVAGLSEAQGQRVEVLARRGHWSQVRTSEGHVGWTLADTMEAIPSQQPGL